MDYKKQAASRKATSKSVSTSNSKSAQRVSFVDNRSSTAAQRKLIDSINGSDTAQRVEDEELMQGKFATAQRAAEEDEELLQGKFDTAQRAGPEEEELLQGKFDTAQRAGAKEEEPLQGKFKTAQRQAGEEELMQGKFADSANTTQLKETTSENKSSLPDNLKSGIESLSGVDVSDVRVHRNSSKPAQLNAHAYAQGNDIHLASGQEQRLPHEAWHVVQQRQGRVQPTMQMGGGVPVNDDEGLEKEADVMGAKAVVQGKFNKQAETSTSSGSMPNSTSNVTSQRKELDDLKGGASTGTGTLVATSDTRSYKTFEKTLPQVDSKEKALNKAAEANGVLGGYVHGNNNTAGILATPNGSGKRHIFETGHSFTKGEFTKAKRVKFVSTTNISSFPTNIDNGKKYYDTLNPTIPGGGVGQAIVNSITNPFNKANVQTIDPFTYKYKIKYNDSDQLGVTYQHADQWTGYVVKIEDAGTGGEIPMADVGNNKKTTTGLPGQYSNRHADTGDDVLSSMISPGSTKTEEKNEENLDAMTKIAGEGARWISVRKHSSKLTNNTKFFVRTTENKIKYVTFQALWLSWASAFDKAYDITDADLRDKIINEPGKFKNSGVQDGTIEDYTTDADYDVTNAKSYSVNSDWTNNYLSVKGSRDKVKIAAWYKNMTRSTANKSVKEYLLGRSHLERIWVDLDDPLKSSVISALNNSDKITEVGKLF